MALVAVDWDDTLVDVQTQEWLPGALEGLRDLARHDDVFVHTCRANWPEGRAEVEGKLAQAGFKLPVVAKPFADRYIDDRAERPDWGTVSMGAAPSSRRRMSRPRRVAGVWVY